MICTPEMVNGSPLWSSHEVLRLVPDEPRGGEGFCVSSTYPLLTKNGQRFPRDSSLLRGGGTEVFMA